MRLGDVVTSAAKKPRPAIVVQSDGLTTPHGILLCPFTTYLLAPIYRLHVEPDTTNGLTSSSQMMVDKVGRVPRDRIGRVIGRLAPADLAKLDAALLMMLDITGE